MSVSLLFDRTQIVQLFNDSNLYFVTGVDRDNERLFLRSPEGDPMEANSNMVAAQWNSVGKHGYR